MLTHIRTLPNPHNVPAEEDFRVRESARRLFERLNPTVREPGIAPLADPLAVYDWEIAGDTEIDLEAVRSALQLLDGEAVVVMIVNEEHRVTALTGR